MVGGRWGGRDDLLPARSNLDPYGEFADPVIYEALRGAGIAEAADYGEGLNTEVMGCDGGG